MFFHNSCMKITYCQNNNIIQGETQFIQLYFILKTYYQIILLQLITTLFSKSFFF